MRRTRFFILLPALLVLFGTSRTAAAGNTLSVFPGCFNNGGGVAVCSPSVTGGTGNYVSYYWLFTDSYWGQPTYRYSWTSTDPWLEQGCRIGAAVTVTLTVTDSQGETGTGTHSIYCSGWAD
jgi:hypothetical protein